MNKGTDIMSATARVFAVVGVFIATKVEAKLTPIAQMDVLVMGMVIIILI